MNVLLNDFSRMNTAIVEYLASCADVSIYLSVSKEDTLRIIREVKPEVIIFCRNYALESTFASELSKICTDSNIYLCETGSTKSSTYQRHSDSEDNVAQDPYFQGFIC